MNFRTALKATVAGALVGTGVYHLVRQIRSARGGAHIHLYGYHRVVDHVVDDGPINPALCISATTFRSQMEQVRRQFRVLTFAEALSAIDGNLPLDRDACAITFDDGYADVYLRAAPILSDLGLPATLFVSSGYVGTSRRFTHDRLYAALWHLGRRRGHLRPNPSEVVDALIARLPGSELERVAEELEACAKMARPGGEARAVDRSELRSLAQSGWEIGAHTIDHVVLVHEPPARVEDQLLLPKIDLESWTEQPCRYFAYCNGYLSPSLVEALKRCGYEGAVTTHDRPNRRGGDRFRVNRKVLWEAHARGVAGKWSPWVSAANLHDLFGALGLTRPKGGECQEVACAV
jgi:peptidoglycan/xylan/chitin deacetylase (PgdA/CDA1 family)